MRPFGASIILFLLAISVTIGITTGINTNGNKAEIQYINSVLIMDITSMFRVVIHIVCMGG